MDKQTDARKNRLLAALPEDALERWLPHLEPMDMPLGHVLYEPGNTLSHVYFPTSAIVSLLYVMQNGASAEIAVVGNEGIVGISLLMGGGSTPSRAVVQSAGKGFRLAAQLMKDEFDLAGPTLNLLLRYTQALITQMAQTAVCNRHHTLSMQRIQTYSDAGPAICLRSAVKSWSLLRASLHMVDRTRAQGRMWRCVRAEGDQATYLHLNRILGRRASTMNAPLHHAGAVHVG